MYHNGTDWIRLAKGTASQTLKMNAGATAPEWVTVAAASSTWEYISTATASASASLAFTNMVDTYDYHYAFDAILPTNDSNDMTAQLGVAGPTYRTSGYKSTVCGINNSGFGRTHGEAGFKAFSNQRSVMKQSRLSPMKLLYPPYTGRVKRLIRLLLKYI